jgi:uncharacterized protein (TIGR02246 family)
MSSPGRETFDHGAAEVTIRGFIGDMVSAWNRGSGEGFAVHFADDADFIAFEGTHLQGRAQIVAFHQQLFDTVLEGTRLWGEPKFVHVVHPRLALMHAVAGMTLAGEAKASPSRDSMQLFVVTRDQETWRIQAVLNARKLTLEQQYFWDKVEAIPPDARGPLVSLAEALSEPRSAR